VGDSKASAGAEGESGDASDGGDTASVIDWVVLTMGDRPDGLAAALASIEAQESGSERAVVVLNGCDADVLDDHVCERHDVVELPTNIGVSAGRDVGLKATTAALVGFLDDDARLLGSVTDQIRAAFGADDRLAVVSLRMVDEGGETDRHHAPRPGARPTEESGDVALFVGGAAVFRRDAYDNVGGYFLDLVYGHEEVELCWRLIDAGWRITYLADLELFHPRMELSQRPRGWWLTGRNRVWVARRTLPWPVAAFNVGAWLVLGLRRAPKGECRRSYFAGWRAGWGGPIERNPISWSGVWRLTRLGRPPII